MSTLRLGLMLALAHGALLLGACGDDDRSDPAGPDGGAGSGGDVDSGNTGDGAVDATSASCRPRPASTQPERGTCGPGDGDYAPCTDDGYAACVSDDGEYHPIQETISTIARVEAFEEIAELLFDPSVDPKPEDFLRARMLYQEDEGLDSRVVRRYDPYFDVPDGTNCTLEGVPAMYPDYCVGPAKLQPILLDAFNRGAVSDGPREQAARIEAALLWFLFVSSHKESVSCIDTIQDCDSAFAYYTGGADARGGIGLARYVEEVDAYAHDRAWDALLAVRCWRDLDDSEMAEDLALHERARAQYYRALVDGVAAIVRDRLEQMGAASGDEQRYHFRFVTTLGPAIVPEAEARSAEDGETLAGELAKDAPEDIAVDAAIAAIDAVYDCP